MMKLKLLGALLLSIALMAGCSSGVTQQEYDRVKATATALEQENIVHKQKVTEASKLATVVDSLFTDIIFPQSQSSPAQGGPSQGGLSQELVNTLAQQVAAQGNPTLQAKLNELLQAGAQGPSKPQLEEFDRMVRATGNSGLISTWERIMQSGGGNPPQSDPLNGIETIVQSSGNAVIEGKFAQFKRANQEQGGIAVIRLAEIVELIRKSGKPDLVKQVDDALTASFGGSSMTLAGIVRFGTAVRAVGDPTLEAMADKIFSGQGDNRLLIDMITYLMGKLTDSLEGSS